MRFGTILVGAVERFSYRRACMSRVRRGRGVPRFPRRLKPATVVRFDFFLAHHNTRSKPAARKYEYIT